MNRLLKLLLLPLLTLYFSCMTQNEISHVFPESYKNDDPIILVHGLNGFGREKFDNFYYWGGSLDLETYLKDAGFDVRTADIGPLSSNWDRSCELYACIKGGRVDYGEEHSLKAGHNRYGRVYKGLYPEWGTVNEKTGKIRKVHIIAHSMGGMTARMTAQLLSEGYKDEQENRDMNPLFSGNKNWIKSIMTISSPHDGTSLTYEFNSYRQRDLITYLALGLMDRWDESFVLYNDLQLDHWSFMNRQVNESEEDYQKRLNDIIRKWKWNNKDFSDFDLTPEGAWEMNGWVKAQPRIYYFSWKTRITEEKKNTYSTHAAMSHFLIPFAQILLSYQGYRSSMINIDRKWLHNDGIVNSISQDGPKLNSSDRIVPLNGKIQRGQWNYMGELFPLDHMQVLGWSSSVFTPREFKHIDSWYKEQAAFLTALPNSEELPEVVNP
jgi:triacylglycerol lipase